jgi:hypothetical protein
VNTRAAASRTGRRKDKPKKHLEMGTKGNSLLRDGFRMR